MKLIVTFFNHQLVFKKQEHKSEKVKIYSIFPGQYVVCQTESKTDINFYRFDHQDFYFEFEKSSWNNPDFLKKNKIEVQKIKKQS